MLRKKEKQKGNNSIKYWILYFIIIGVVLLVGYSWSSKKLTYKEYTAFGAETSTEWMDISVTGDELEQTFFMPYDIMQSIAFKIGTFEKKNNSEWIVQLYEESSGRKIYEKEFSASLIVDNSYYEIEFAKNLKVKKGEKYIVLLKAKNVSDGTKLAFYTDVESQDDLALYHGNNKVNGQLVFKIYGGDKDYWWLGLFCTVFSILGVMLFRVLYLFRKNVNPLQDKVVLTLLVGILYFLMRSSFSIADTFTDELDNMRGGFIIANGGVLYKDYIVQHTPVVYYLCAIFALFGAKSICQFRISYYIVEAIIWAFAYARHATHFGRKKLLLLPLIEVICISSVVGSQGYQVLSDGWQGLMLVLLMLEFLEYYKDRNLKWDRCIVVSVCIWGSFGAAFVSAYSLIFLVVAVLIVEIDGWKNHKISLQKFLGRYYKLIIAVVVPFICAIVYFKHYGALKQAYDQCYAFNRTVYPKYIDGLGGNLLQPFINGVQNSFGLFSDNFNSIVSATANNVNFLQLLIIALAIIMLVKMVERKRYVESFTLLLVMMGAATRGYGFHGLAAWYIAVMIFALNIDSLKGLFCKLGKPAIVLLGVFFISTYGVAVGNNLLYKETSVSELENAVIELTKEDNDKEIFLDAYSYDSLYFSYKKRDIVNPAVYMLPWYMEKYEINNITAIKEKKPKVVVYNEDRDCWGYSHYNNELDQIIEANYTRLGDFYSGWKYNVWIRND